MQIERGLHESAVTSVGLGAAGDIKRQAVSDAVGDRSGAAKPEDVRVHDEDVVSPREEERVQQLLADGMVSEEELAEWMAGEGVADNMVVVGMDHAAGEMLVVVVERGRRERAVALDHQPGRDA